jgi:hypothetical protein
MLTVEDYDHEKGYELRVNGKCETNKHTATLAKNTSEDEPD